MKGKLLFLFGLLMLGSAVGCRLLVAPHWTQRVPPGWSWQAKFVGAGAVPDEKTGQFPNRDTLNLYEREVKIADESGRPDAVVVEDRYTLYDRATRKITWEYIIRETIDPQTGAHILPEYQGDVALFPRGTQKQTYSLRFSYLKGVPVEFEGEERVDGLVTYVFGYQGRGEYTESYGGSPHYPGVKVQPGQEIKCADDQFSLRVWVEPRTGEIVKMDERAPSGDWIYDIATGAKLTPVLRWGGNTAGDDVLRRVDTISAERRRLLWLEYLPGLLAGLGLGCWLICGLRLRARSRPPTVAEPARPE